MKSRLVSPFAAVLTTSMVSATSVSKNFSFTKDAQTTGQVVAITATNGFGRHSDVK